MSILSRSGAEGAAAREVGDVTLGEDPDGTAERAANVTAVVRGAVPQMKRARSIRVEPGRVESSRVEIAGGRMMRELESATYSRASRRVEG
jgi:hypothetical protein